jgi:hypothetical protein
MQERASAIPSYGLDIGKYTLGVRGQVCASKTTTAWARLASGIASFHELPAVGTRGTSITGLAGCINADLESGPVALGFEAPMWLPIARRHKESLQLFKGRFPKEDECTRQWYLNGGAAAALKALSLGIMLLSLVRNDNPGVRLTTQPNCGAQNTIVLFEAFVTAEEFKLAGYRPSGITEHEWDAFLASLAWGALHKSFSVPARITPLLLHAAGSEPSEALSIWKTIASNVPSLPPVDGPPDCDVVALAEMKSPSRALPLK